MNNTAVSFLSLQDRHIYHQLFNTVNTEKKSFLLKKEAIAFFSTSGVPSEILEKVWQIVNDDQRDFINELEFYKIIKLIACVQNDIEATDDILSTQVPVPQFKGATIAEIAPITANERETYMQIFQSCNPIDGVLYGQQAKEVFLRSNLTRDKLNAIWLLADTRSSGTLNKTEFIIAMHYISQSFKNHSLTLPTSLPSQVYVEASGQFASSIRRHNTTTSSMALNRLNKDYTSPIMGRILNSSPLNMIDGPNSIHPMVSVAPEEIERYKTYFDQLDCDRSGYIDAEDAIYFLSYSQLPDDELKRIWEIADHKHLGKLDMHAFGVAMHLINTIKRGERIDRYESLYYQKKQGGFNQQISPAFQNLQIQPTEDSNLRYELENQMIELKQQFDSEYKRAEEYRKQFQQEHQLTDLLEKEMVKIKAEQEAVKMAAEDAEKMLIEEQWINEHLTASTPYQVMDDSRKSSSVHVDNAPELTRAPSTFSSSSIMSPHSGFNTSAMLPSTVLDPFEGFKRMDNDLGIPSSPSFTLKNLNDPSTTTANSQLSLSPVQSKAISKYGFDITAFDTLSINDNYEKSTGYTVKDDLAAIFGAPQIDSTASVSSSSKSTNVFDNIFL